MDTYSAVGVPAFNTVLATKYIHENASFIFQRHEKLINAHSLTDLTGYTKTVNPVRLAKLIDHFMSVYSRGKGTKGREDLREFYAACYVLKQASSRNRYFRSKDADISLARKHATQSRSALYRFDVHDGRLIDTIHNKTFLALVDEGLATSDGRESWLTDYGMKVYGVARALRNRLETEAKEKKAKTLSEAHKLMKDKVIDLATSKKNELLHPNDADEVKIWDHILLMANSIETQ